MPKSCVTTCGLYHLFSNRASVFAYDSAPKFVRLGNVSDLCRHDRARGHPSGSHFREMDGALSSNRETGFLSRNPVSEQRQEQGEPATQKNIGATDLLGQRHLDQLFRRAVDSVHSRLGVRDG